jgi:acyl carrier protein
MIDHNIQALNESFIMTNTTSETNVNGSATSQRENVEAAIRQFILKQFPAARSRGIGAADSLLTQGVIDSLGVLEVVTFIENQFGLTVSDDEMLSDHFESIARITDLVTRKLAREDATWTT